MRSISPELIQKYLRGECTEQEKELVIKWYDSFDQKADPYLKLTPIQQEELRGRMLSNISQQIEPAFSKKRASIFCLKNLLYISGAAAVFLLAFNFSGWISRINSIPAVTGNDNEIVVKNSSGSILRQVLPDQSIVWLSPDAQIKYNKHFKQACRAVRLTGESFFEVTKDKKHPFIIYSEHLTTKVWGTSFRIRDFKNSKNAEVAVVTGRVSVKSKKHNGQDVMLLPEQMVEYTENEKILQVTRINKKSALGIWKKANLTFDNKPLQEVIKTLNRQFDVAITLDDKRLNNFLMQADFNEQSLPDIMLILSKLLNCTYTTDGHQFLLQKNNKQNQI